MSDLEYYLQFDHGARSKTTLLSVLAAGIAAFITKQFNSDLKMVAIVCFVVVGALELGRAWFYVQPSSRSVAGPSSDHSARLSLAVATIFLVITIVATLFPTSQLEAAVTEHTLKENAADPTSPENIKTTETVLGRAESAKLKIKPHVIEEAGAKFIQAAESSESAWDVAIAFANYRSTLNTEPPLPPISNNKFADTFYGYSTIHGDLAPKFTHYGVVPISQAARLNKLGVDFNPGPVGDAVLVGEGGSLFLDDTEARQVILRRTTIVYNGGPVLLNQVYFVDCKFAINQSPSGIALAQALLRSGPAITFTRSE